jgi:hypothetical protein
MSEYIRHLLTVPYVSVWYGDRISAISTAQLMSQIRESGPEMPWKGALFDIQLRSLALNLASLAYLYVVAAKSYRLVR